MPGGAENVLIVILNKLVERYPQFKFHLCICDEGSVGLDRVHPRVRIINFSKSKLRYCLKDLIIYFKNESPEYFISSLDYANILASFAHKCAFVNTKLILWEHSVTSIHSINTISKYLIVRYILINYFYNRANFIICVSKGVLNDLNNSFNIKRNKLLLIYNPIDHDSVNQLSSITDFKSDSIIKKGDYILSIGRLVQAKNLDLLIKAFNKVRSILKYKLIIMGAGPEKSNLEKLIAKLDLSNDVYLIGHFSNPYFIIKRSEAVISSSKWEGLPLALIESLALGKYIISTDCPYGPREILDDGRYGKLVLPNNVELLSDAIKDIPFKIRNIDKKRLIDRSNYFSLDRALNKFDKIFKI